VQERVPPPVGLGDAGVGDAGVGEAEVGRVLGDWLGVWLRLADGLLLGGALLARVTLGDGLPGADADGLVDGGVPVPEVNTRTDSAGTVTEVPDRVLVVIVGLALLYRYSVVVPPVMPRLDVVNVYPVDGLALASMTPYPPPGRLA
jgi:hypothetical protein